MELIAIPIVLFAIVAVGSLLNDTGTHDRRTIPRPDDASFKSSTAPDKPGGV